MPSNRGVKHFRIEKGRNMIEMLFILLSAHALCDYPLQGDFLAKAKNSNDKDIVKFMGEGFWVHALVSHSLIHGGAVALVTGSVALGVAETICHALIDHGKCQNKFNIHVDQALHVACKVLWVFML